MMTTDRGYTGPREDLATELDYYHARYYDPAGSQFASAPLALHHGWQGGTSPLHLPR